MDVFVFHLFLLISSTMLFGWLSIGWRRTSYKVKGYHYALLTLYCIP